MSGKGHFINMMGRVPMFDAQCDFAAIAFEVGDDPDGLLLQFAEDLRRSGHRVVGATSKGCATQTWTRSCCRGLRS